MKEISKDEFEQLVWKYTEITYEFCTDDNDFHNYMSFSLIPMSFIGKEVCPNNKPGFFATHFSYTPCLRLTKNHHVICLSYHSDDPIGSNTKYYIDFHKVGQCKQRDYASNSEER